MFTRSIKAIGHGLLAALVLISCAVDAARADPPPGWFAAGSKPTDYDMSADGAEKKSGKFSGSIKSTASEAEGFGTMMQQFRSDDYRSKRLRLTGHIKSKDVENWAGLWMRVDGAEKFGVAFDNMQDRPIKGTTEWKQYEIVLDVPEDSVLISFGVLMRGKGHVWMDDLKFEVVGNDVNTTGKEAAPRDYKIKLPLTTPKQPRNLDFEK